MKFENLDKLFELYVHEAVRKNKEKYSSHEALEDDLGMLFNRFENVRIKTLDGKTPKEYAAELREDGEIFDYVSKCLENNIEVTDTICDEVVRAEGATEYLNGLLYENNKDAKLLAALLLKEIDDEEVEDIFISVLTNDEMPDEVKTVAFEYLSDGDDCVPEKILEIINSVPEKNQGILVEVLSNFKGRKDVFYWLVTMLQRAEDVPTYAGLLGRYGDTAAIDILKSFASEVDINYVEFVEIRNAVEELGGEMTEEKDFSDDPYYKYINHIGENGENPETVETKN
ncbi:MAG: hypothetical protein MR895_05580 [Clostridiales bacterium]|nr:hypothetical protein [Clostridiales bacterium]